ncbi:MAG TPA: hypothetical protein VIA62_26445 [Thermoanaerobaculia bacterium]|jgi:hypothetical protein|nr:hypothetical protein [Thermoanaerobaculia bacterium]
MSLISDALKKARQEAARQDALRPSLPYAVGTVDPPERRRPYVPVLAGLGAGCVLAALVFGIVYLGGWGPFARPAKPAVQVAEVSSPAATPAPAPVTAAPPPPVIEEKSRPVPPEPAPTPAPRAAKTPEVQLRPAPPVQAAPPVPEKPAVRPEPSPAPPIPAEEARLAPPPAPTPAPAPVPTVAGPIRAPAPPAAADSTGLAEGKAYVGEVPVPGGGVVKLNGIAYSPEHPIAVLDGRAVAPGEVIQGFTVVEIQADHVTLQGHGARVSVSLK